MSTRSTAFHEAGHAVLGWSWDFTPKIVTIRPNERHLGACIGGDLDPYKVDDLACATILMAGEVAERMSRGREPIFNWFADTGRDGDHERARWFTDRYPEPLKVRDLALLRTRSSLTVRWRAVEAIAHELERRELILGDDVERLCVQADILKAGKTRPKRIDATRRFMVIEGKRITLEEWAAAVGRNGHNPDRARKEVREDRNTRTHA